MNKNKIMQSAKLCGKWLLKNQINNLNDANHGRFLAEIAVKSKKVNEWSTNWTSGMSVISLLMLKEVSKSDEYDTAIKSACEYISSLQVDGHIKKECIGTIREVTPQTDCCHPRDALSAAWGLWHAGNILKNKEWRERALAFGEWFIKYSMKGGYPAWTFHLNDQEHDWLLGSFHGGSPLFFFDLYEKTKDEKWLKKAALPIINFYLKTFMNKKGAISVVIDPKTRKSPMRQKKYQAVKAWAHMHTLNDDFTALALMRAWKITGKDKYIQAAKNFLKLAISQQLSGGGYGTPEVPSACPSLIVELLDMHRLSGENEYLTSAELAAKRLLEHQQIKDRSADVHGGFYGMVGLNGNDIRHSLHIRTSAYALAALVKLTGKYSGPLYSA